MSLVNVQAQTRERKDFYISVALSVCSDSNYTETSLRALLEHLCAKSCTVFGRRILAR